MTYLGFDHNLDKPVAIKEYLPSDIAVRTADRSVAPQASEFRGDFQSSHSHRPGHSSGHRKEQAMTDQPQPLTQTQDHDRRIGRLEGIVEQLDRRLDAIERAIAELRGEVRASIRWLIGIQIASLIAIGSLLFSILGKLP